MMGVLLGRPVQRTADHRDIACVEWILVALLVMMAIVGAFQPQFRNMVTAGITAVANHLQTLSGAGAS